MNELLYQQGGNLVLDEKFTSRPVSATVTIHTMSDEVLSTIDSTFTDIEDATCVVDDLTLTLSASAKGARVFTPSATSGTITDLTDDGYRLLINRGGRKYFASVSEYDTDGTDVVSFRVDEGIDFIIQSGDYAYGLRVSYDVDWSAVTDDFTGRVKAIWAVTLDDGTISKIGKVYDCVKQVITKQATWADVVARRPDADIHLSEIRDKERLVDVAWDDIVTKLYNMGIRHNLIYPDYSTVLRDATVMQCLYNMVMHQGIPAPILFAAQGRDYTDWLHREISSILGQFLLPIDDNEDGILSRAEAGVNRRAVWFRSRTNRRIYSEE